MKKKIRFSIGADNKSKCVSIAKEYLIENKYSFNEYKNIFQNSTQELAL